MPKRPKYPMPIEERAKLFMPFDALKGFQEALESKRHISISVPRRTLGEDRMEELNSFMQTIEVGAMVTVIYFSEDKYFKKTGIVSRIDSQQKWIQIVKSKIFFRDIFDIELA